MEFSPVTLSLLGLLMVAWSAIAAWAWLRGRSQLRTADAVRKRTRRLSRMLDEAPAIPLLIRTDGRIEAPPRLARWLGMEQVPEFLSELEGENSGLAKSDLDQLNQAVRSTQKTGAPFKLAMTAAGSRRSLAMRGALADPQVSPGGAALVWVFDFSDSENELAKLRDETAQAKSDFAGLVGLIEAAPMPMWFRAPDGKLQLVNAAYVGAVDASSSAEVVEKQLELVEPVDGASAADMAAKALAKQTPFERTVTATIDGQRRTIQVSDLPLKTAGVAGYAVDIEEMEELSREFRAFRQAQRSMIDQLSVGVAQFDSKRSLIFSNQPFQRIFSLSREMLADQPKFARLLDMARDEGRVPEVRDYPSWRNEMEEWFSESEAQEDQWPLSGGTHLRVVGQPMPDGGLVLIAEDRTEQLALSAVRDTLLRTRTATFDSLFEALAAFAPDGKLQLWNRRFADLWSLDEEYLAQHPKAQDIIEKVSGQLARNAFAARMGAAVRSATLDRKQKGGRLELADGRVLEFAGVPLPDGNGLLTLLDVTDSQKAETALRERAEALEEADAVKTRFLANMSYEFRTPLTSIGGFAEMLQAGVAGELTDQGKEYVDAILTSVERLSEQIENVLDLSQSEAGLLPLEKQPINILSFMTELVRDREAKIVAGGLSLDLKGDQSAGTISADAKRLNSALGHLLDNAIEATHRNGRILVVLKRSGKGVQIVISDNGKGMTQRALTRALKGTSIQSIGKPAERRRGLGLPLAKQLIEAHDGKLKIDSEPGLGTTVTIVLP